MTLFQTSVAAFLVAVVSAAAAEDVRFNRDIRPILSGHCFKCHGPDLKKGGLELHLRDSALKARGTRGAAIVPGKSEASRIIERITAADATERMPPKGDALTPAQVAKLKAWIEQGAVYEEHWAYVKPVRPPLSDVQNKTWSRNPLDVFVLARLEKEGLQPSPEADRATLIRRLSLDLTGLPPTITEVNDFLSDQSPEAYEKVVDRLLRSPHYGEHEALYWLDQARYADTNGYEKDERRTHWPYRDWVIAAFNRDMPFDQFTIEQLAGDLLPNATLAQKMATGFHRNTMTNTEGGTDDEEFRVAAVVDRVNTTMAVWMGLTMGCAQCHNHKYDPFTQKEYYQLFAYLNSTEDPGRSVNPTLPIPNEAQLTHAHVAQEIAVSTAMINASPSLLRRSMDARLQARLAALRQDLMALKPASMLVMKELPKARTSSVLIRGNHKTPGDKVQAGVPARLNPAKPGLPANRLGLAKWLVDPDNPLTARVTMNRVWARTFGRGLVDTSEDFGIRGDLPTHPELLDWLAVEFMEGSTSTTLSRRPWSMKGMYRLIVTSAAYRQASRVTPALLEKDPYNRLFARGPRFRLPAEAVRDNALAISGLLSRKIGGPSVFPFQPDGVWFNPYSSDKWVTSPGGDQYRRGLYTFWRRTAPYAAFMAFDAPSREIACERRPRTNTPLQALTTLNDRAFVQPAAALARRMMTEAGGERERIERGFRLCVARKPTDAEVELLMKLYKERLEKYRKDAKSAAELATSGLAAPPKELDVAELAAWTVVANVLLNLDETLTKG